MRNRSKRMLVVGGAALAVVGGGGAALAAGGNPFGGSNDRQAVLNDAAQRLNVKPAELQSALKQAMLDRIDAALEAGRITQQQATELKARVNAGDGLGPAWPGGHGFGFHHGGPGGPGAGLDAAATYLGLTQAQLRTQLESGKTLAQVAKAQGKSTDGLKKAMLADAKTHLDADVKSGKLTKTEADQILKDISSRLDDLVQNGFHFRAHDGDRPGGRGFFGRPSGGFAGPPPSAPAAA